VHAGPGGNQRSRGRDVECLDRRATCPYHVHQIIDPATSCAVGPLMRIAVRNAAI
jgi:hypothetical protein